MRRLIINADDFGLTCGVNRAIVEAHTGGIVTSATLMANAGAFDDAVRLAKANAQLGVGCHVVLVDGVPVADPGRVSTLLARRQEDGFRKTAGSLGLAAWAGRVSATHIAAEAIAQIGRLQAAGIRVTHVDTHKHVHMFPQVLQAVVDAAQACGVRTIRNPFEPLRLAQLRQKSAGKRWLQVGTLGALAGRFRRIIQRAGMVAPHGCLGIVSTGSLDQARLCDLLEHCPEGTWELVCHPGYADADLAKAGTRLQQSRPVELEALTSTAAQESLRRQGIELISYRDLL